MTTSRCWSCLLAVLWGCGSPSETSDGPSPFGDEGGSPTSADAETTSDPGEGGSEDPGTTAPATTASPTTAPGEAGSDEGSSSATDDSGGSGTSDGGTTGTSSESTGSESSSSTGVADTSNDGVLDVAVTVQSTWQDGECDDVTVTNVSAMPVAWQVDVPLPGTIGMLWNATEVSEAGGVGTFAGVDFNASLDPGAAAMWGFCVDY